MNQFLEVPLIVGDIEKKESTLSHVFGERLKDYLISQGIDTYLIEPSALTLDENETLNKILAYESNYALEFKRTGQIANVTTIPGHTKTVGTPGQPGYSTTYVPGSVSTELTYYYEMKIFDTTTNKNIWRSKISIKGPVKMDIVDELIHDVLRLLVDDDMLDLNIDMLPVYKPKKILSTEGQLILKVAISIPLLIYALNIEEESE